MWMESGSLCNARLKTTAPVVDKIIGSGYPDHFKVKAAEYLITASRRGTCLLNAWMNPSTEATDVI